MSDTVYMRTVYGVLALMIFGCQTESVPSVTGTIGPTGAQGQSGAMGATGPTGAAITVLNGFLCQGSVVIASQNLTFRYKATKFTTGDLMVSCSVSGSQMQSSNSDFHRSGSSGASNYGCSLVYDVDAASAGSWLFTYQGGTRAFTYVDASSSHNNETGGFYSYECTDF